MPSVKVSLEAKNDIREIVRYTKEEWSREQAEKYVDGMEVLFSKLISVPSMGRPSKLPLEGYREMTYKSHIIFYSVQGNDIHIARVLHSQMDTKRQFER